MSQLGLDEIERRARNLASAHQLEGCLLTEFGKVSKLYAYVLQDERGYHFIIPDEDGSEMERQTTQNADDVLYWVICDAAMGLAMGRLLSEEGHNRRSAWAERQLEILGQISPEWQNRRRAEWDRRSKPPADK